MKKILILGLLALGGCAVVPAEPVVYAPPRPVYVAPSPVYVAPPPVYFGFGYRGYYGHRHWR